MLIIHKIFDKKKNKKMGGKKTKVTSLQHHTAFDGLKYHLKFQMLYKNFK